MAGIKLTDNLGESMSVFQETKERLARQRKEREERRAREREEAKRERESRYKSYSSRTLSTQINQKTEAKLDADPEAAIDAKLRESLKEADEVAAEEEQSTVDFTSTVSERVTPKPEPEVTQGPELGTEPETEPVTEPETPEPKHSEEDLEEAAIASIRRDRRQSKEYLSKRKEATPWRDIAEKIAARHDAEFDAVVEQAVNKKPTPWRDAAAEWDARRQNNKLGTKRGNATATYGKKRYNRKMEKALDQGSGNNANGQGMFPADHLSPAEKQVAESKARKRLRQHNERKRYGSTKGWKPGDADNWRRNRSSVGWIIVIVFLFLWMAF